MTLYEFRMLQKTEQYNTIWNKGIYLDNIKENGNMINLYAIDRFFVEVVYSSESNKIIENRCFEDGDKMDKYSSGLSKYFE